MSSLNEILASIESRLADLHTEISSLQAARAELRNGHSAPAAPAAAPRATGRRRGPARAKPAKASADQRVAATPADAPATPAPAVPAHDPGAQSAATTSTRRSRSATRRARGRKAAKVLVAGSLEAMLRESGDGLSAAAIARGANARDGQVRDLLRELATAGRVRQSGARRASRWRLVTDEERIAERAAELAARSAAKS